MRSSLRPPAWLLLTLLGASGCLESRPRGSLEVQLLGPAYPRPRCAKGQLELGRLYPLGEPVSGARVELSPGGALATSDAEGRVRFAELAEDEYQLEVAAAGFLPANGLGRVRSGETATVQVGLDPCVSAGRDQHKVGFEAGVDLRASTRCGSAWEGASYSWTQLEGPELAGTVSSWEGAVLKFRTRSLEEVRGPLPDEAQLLSFSHDQAGEYVFQVTARSPSGEVARDTVLVTSTNVTGGLNSVPPHEVYYFLGHRQASWAWKVIDQPATWQIYLGGEDTRTPFLEAIPPPGLIEPQRNITIMDMKSATQFSLVVGGWGMVNRDCGRSDCHAALQHSWEGTRHASTWRKLIDGELTSERGPVAESCATCHALGYDPGAPNGGYDDASPDPAARFPQPPRAGNFAGLSTGLKNVSNVYCLACHGPARVDPPVAEQPGRFSSGVCARCHDRLPEQDLVAQWRTSKMARTIKGDQNGAEQRPECKRCHSAQGFYYTHFALGRPPSTGVAVLNCCENLAPISCQTCHSPMYARNPAQVFRYGEVRTASGLDLKEIGAGALCVTCHSTDHEVLDTVKDRLAPHSPQAELSYGRGGFPMSLPAGAPDLPALAGVACSSTAGQGCVTCHMDKGPLVGQPGHRQVGDHTFRMTSSEGLANTRPCQVCHPGRVSFDPRAGGDYDGDGTVEVVRAEVDGLMALLRDRLSARIQARAYLGCDAQQSAAHWVKSGDRSRLVLIDQHGYDLGDCDRNGVIEREEQAFVFPDADLVLHQAAYNFLFLEQDGSRGLHNLPYAVKLLQRTLVALTGNHNLPGWELHR